MLVDVRESGEKRQGSINGSLPVVRLHALDECIRLFGNPRKVLGEYVVRDRGFERNGRITLSRQGTKKGKLAAFTPIRKQRNSHRVTLDEFERQMIEGGPHLIKRLAGEDGYVARGLSGDRQLLCVALRLGPGDLIGATGCIFGNASLERFDVFRSPGQLKFRGCQSSRFHGVAPCSDSLKAESPPTGQGSRLSPCRARRLK